METALGASLNALSQAPDILETPYKFHVGWAEETALGASLNAQSQAPDEIIWVLFTPRINSVIHTFSSIIIAFADKSLQGYSRRRTAHTFPFSWCHKTGHRNSLNAT